MARVAYGRVSTDGQHLDGQLDRLAAAGYDRLYTDQGVSGTKASRPEWDKCLASLERGDTLVVVKLDRMGRSVLNLLHLLTDLQERGIDLVVLDIGGGQALDTSTPFGKLMFTMLAMFAEFERDLIAERTRTGLAAAHRAGHKSGPKFGLTEAEQEQLAAMSAAGQSSRQIAAVLGKHPATICRYLQRRQETGGPSLPVKVREEASHDPAPAAP